jgi:metallo-beta-lactamase family protein
LVGYQANGTLGRVLQDGAHRVRMMGSEIEVKAHISIMDVYSGHADAPELLRWIKQRGTIKGSIFLVHGEEEAFEAMAATLAKALPNVPVVIPDLDDVFDLADGHAVQTKSDTPARLMPEQLGRIDWNNDLSKLVLDLNEAIGNLPDANSRAKMIRRLRRTLEDAS